MFLLRHGLRQSTAAVPAGSPITSTSVSGKYGDLAFRLPDCFPTALVIMQGIYYLFLIRIPSFFASYSEGDSGTGENDPETKSLRFISITFYSG